MTAREQQDERDEMAAAAATERRQEQEGGECTVCREPVRNAFVFRASEGHLRCVLLVALDAIGSKFTSEREIDEAEELIAIHLRQCRAAVEERAGRARQGALVRELKSIVGLGSGS